MISAEGGARRSRTGRVHLLESTTQGTRELTEAIADSADRLWHAWFAQYCVEVALGDVRRCRPS